MPRKSRKPRKATKQRLTLKEQKLLEVLLDPANRMKSVTEICGIVGCDRSTYYRAFEKKTFADLYNRLSANLAKRHLGQVMNAFVREATRGSFQHGKVLLEMAGVLTKETPDDDKALAEFQKAMAGAGDVWDEV